MKTVYIEILGAKHPLCFSLVASEELINRFGSLDDLLKMLKTPFASMENVAAINDALSILMRAGRVYAGYYGMDVPEPLICKPADALGVRIRDAALAIVDTITNDSTTEIDTEDGKRKKKSGGNAWIYYSGARAGLTRFEVRNLPIGQVLDQISCYKIAECGAKAVYKATGSLFEQMSTMRR